tara:strand:- start:160 stop:441 length:282 start_codon:yes stop_codon:yes gene_type:complete
LSFYIALLLICSFSVSAQEPGFRKHQWHGQRLSSVQRVTIEQAMDRVRRDTGGRVLSAAPINKAGMTGYDVRVLLDGKRVRKVFVRTNDQIKR